MRPIRVALVGCGAVSRLYYAPALAELERRAQLQVAAMFDPDPASVDHLHAAFPASVRVNGLDDLSASRIDLAIIASPPRFHAEQAIVLLRAGLAVLCEKPMATTVVEAEAMIEAARAARRPLAIGLVRRFFPATRMIHDLLSLDRLGQIRSFACLEGDRFRWPARSISSFERTGRQGGVLLDIGVHLLDLLIWWWGPPVEVFYEDDATGGLEVNCRLRLTFAQGFSGEVRLSRDWPLPNCYVIEGSDGWLSWPVNEADWLDVGFRGHGYAFRGRLHEPGGNPLRSTVGSPASTFAQSFVNQLSNVLGAARGVMPLIVPAEQALESLKLIEHCYRHRGLMDMPWLSAEECRRAQELSRSP